MPSRNSTLAQAGAGDAGERKKGDNETIEILPTGERKLRFIPTSVGETWRWISSAGIIRRLVRRKSFHCS
jgi:hypothetical protein